jgi:hypothetical protein
MIGHGKHLDDATEQTHGEFIGGQVHGETGRFLSFSDLQNTTALLGFRKGISNELVPHGNDQPQLSRRLVLVDVDRRSHVLEGKLHGFHVAVSELQHVANARPRFPSPSGVRHDAPSNISVPGAGKGWTRKGLDATGRFHSRHGVWGVFAINQAFSLFVLRPSRRDAVMPSSRVVQDAGLTKIPAEQQARMLNPPHAGHASHATHACAPSALFSSSPFVISSLLQQRKQEGAKACDHASPRINHFEPRALPKDSLFVLVCCPSLEIIRTLLPVPFLLFISYNETQSSRRKRTVF